ncbi:YggS family pyridoxal phosphate-dependent enzyme [Microbacterium sp. zg-Y818]|uniref:YggS family pyridoxal phosphate-dependent enzyme n=1 Tax=unclassified Microbacterium TaxID=2609290 RepID=UPI00214B5CE5|nr:MULTISPECIES: YggS family pyridoxal phosphate-dependent enzyme [unclassified Microbacterium]MCR2800639.1 YggS family pyridoxal phosphate-dependent enzyme [Microbacterium sp. zg.Y818]WIM23365.1 YggS family pyridoxal phosphate-dependent enzyme [Microbacterium sp. zg-Y818]
MDLKARLADVDARIVDAARSAGRDPGEITRVVVTKFHPASLIRELYDLGVRDVGENRQQELTAKRAELADLADLRWHFVGQAQTNKARAIREAAAVVHSVDRARLADALEAAGQSVAGILDVLLQVNLTDDAGRGGTSPDDVAGLAEHIVGTCPTLRVRGVMGVAPLDEPAADAFARLAAARDQVRAVVPDAGWMSAGMTGDFSEAIAAGATHLRIGSAITGPRPVHG